MTPDDLYSRMTQLPAPPAGQHPPHWQHWRRELWQHLAISRANPYNFTTWPCVYHTMLHEHWQDMIQREREWLAESVPALVLPDQYLPLSIDIVPVQRALLHQAFHLYQWVETTSYDPTQLSQVIEFGGGFGAMVLLVKTLNPSCQYIIYDTPEFLLLQQWFLEECGWTDIEYQSVYPTSPVFPDLLIACHSLSEVPFRTRTDFLKQIRATRYLFLYSELWQQYNNREWAETYSGSGMTTCQNWLHTHARPKDCLPSDTRYTFGW